MSIVLDPDTVTLLPEAEAIAYISYFLLLDTLPCTIRTLVLPELAVCTKDTSKSDARPVDSHVPVSVAPPVLLICHVPSVFTVRIAVAYAKPSAVSDAV
jgi:hypothetical protein